LILQTATGFLNDGLHCSFTMAGPSWGQIFPHLVSNRLLANSAVRQKLLSMSDPISIINHAKGNGIGPGILTIEDLEILENIAITGKKEQPLTNGGEQIGRTIAPILEAEPNAPLYRNNLPDWRKEDFPLNAVECSLDMQVHFDITGNSITEGKMADISNAFNDRLQVLGKLIVANSNLPRKPMEIARLNAEKSRFQARDNLAVAIGMVNEPRHSKNGHLMFSLEDASGEMKCILMDKRNEGQSGESRISIEAGLMPDDVIGVSGTFSQTGDMFYVDDLHFPLQHRHEKTYAEQAVSVAFLSDIHVGSKTFLLAQWHKMIKWFNEDPLAKTIKYLILSGDCVDGVGIYPGQENELSIKDLFEQYSEFARLLELLPDWVECVMLPGNHDAVRPAEPQPTLEAEIQQDYNSTIFVGNPCAFSLHGVKLLSYHGKSIDDFVAGLRTVTYDDPVEAMRMMLRRRHLAPQWGGKTPLSPEPEDGLVIREVPDIFVTGHVHGHAAIDFKGTTLVCSSTWQDQTSYQRMLGFQPKPCMLTIVNLGTHKNISIPFA
jgi:DNA polymerase II small subunit